MAERGGAPLAAAELPALLERVHAALAARRGAIDDLNVFPVPDGDTGTNMTLTVRAGLEALRTVADAAADARAAAVIRGAVRGARGNSGVILSQVVRAVVEVVSGERAVDAEVYARALQRARELAYEAVADPVEGTILTVIGCAADEARAAVAAGEDLVATSARVVAEARAAVERTRDQLPVLRQAGVVDAGARGFEVLLAAVHGHLTGEDPPVVEEAPRTRMAEVCDGPLSHRFEVQYLLDADDADAAPLRRRLEVLGDSVVVVAAGGLLNVHVHTDDVGAAVEEGLRFGTPSDIEVTHFADQIAANRAARPPQTVGAVAVLHGDGLTALAEQAGAAVVSGRSGALPSVADLLNAVGSVVAERILLLPGHRNGIAAAQQAVAVSSAEGGRPLDVVAAASSPPAVLAALAVLDPQAPAHRVLADVTAAAEAVRAGEVVAAVRDAETPVGRVRRGQLLAVVEGRVVRACEDAVLALEAVCSSLGVADAELVTLLVGAEVDEISRDGAVGVVHELAGGEVEVVDAGQRPALFWVGVE
ncbi:DAK2 domain-containing protein [Egicoccus sp. AB-alg6-2]|uniref:DAK2 domain-containing protein n=1 Tax=Egicoccus sp. AB-alg6-2 TaxID=3242692 RepID=UPI00359F0CA7